MWQCMAQVHHVPQGCTDNPSLPDPGQGSYLYTTHLTLTLTQGQTQVRAAIFIPDIGLSYWLKGRPRSGPLSLYQTSDSHTDSRPDPGQGRYLYTRHRTLTLTQGQTQVRAAIFILDIWLSYWLKGRPRSEQLSLYQTSDSRPNPDQGIWLSYWLKGRPRSGQLSLYQTSDSHTEIKAKPRSGHLTHRLKGRPRSG